MKLFQRANKTKATEGSGADDSDEDDNGYISMKSAARLLGVYPNTVAAWYDSGYIDGYVTPTGLRKIKRAAIEKLLRNKRKVKP